LPEILLEIAARTGFTDAFTHITERTAHAIFDCLILECNDFAENRCLGTLEDGS